MHRRQQPARAPADASWPSEASYGGKDDENNNSGGADASGWTDEDEARAVVANRGMATDKYVRGSQLGIGGWSRVYKVRRVADGRVLAGKASEALGMMRREADILKSLKHEHILKFTDWHEEAGNPAATLLVAELCAHGTLQTRIDQATPSMAREEILLVVRQVGEALAHIHGRQLYHTDVKPKNILIRGLRPMSAVLADCGDVRGTEPTRRRGGPMRGTHSYHSPEMVRHQKHIGPGDDVWALGVTLLSMAAQLPPLPRTNDEIKAYPGRCASHARALLELNPGHGLVRLLASMLDEDVGQRASAERCAAEAARVLAMDDEERGEGTGVLGIQAPTGFRPVSFW
ncbi:hypothetical protein HIM_08647 [Hirsutella minnesotensis 3608]|uniref:Protein kinase domain-containing protein n=1 Tax=Hirsutella minnesotensis 3608 TaxID=1043627 RepID=A0A0F7ZY72_9HYPO|nr:hypothetical protein HIM_08647 [Hirsutella minnesotensis 3608]